MRWRPDSPSLYLPDSGQIDLNAIGVEAGQANNSQTGLNDAAVRGLIGKSSGAQNAMSEYYGASSSDALDSFVFGQSNWLIAFTGLPTAYSITGVERRSDHSSYPHKWPMAEGETEPHALDHPFVAQIKNPTTLNDIWPSFCTNSIVRSSGYKPNLGASGNTGSVGSPNTLIGVQPLQRVKPGVHTFNGSYGFVNAGYDGSPLSIECSILEYETMTPSGSGFASAGGGRRRQQLAYKSRSGGINGTFNGTYATTLTTAYEWIFLELKVITQFNRGTGSSLGMDSIT